MKIKNWIEKEKANFSNRSLMYAIVANGITCTIEEAISHYGNMEIPKESYTERDDTSAELLLKSGEFKTFLIVGLFYRNPLKKGG